MSQYQDEYITDMKDGIFDNSQEISRLRAKISDLQAQINDIKTYLSGGYHL